MLTVLYLITLTTVFLSDHSACDIFFIFAGRLLHCLIIEFNFKIYACYLGNFFHITNLGLVSPCNVAH